MGKLRLTPRAQDALVEIWRTIAADNPVAADKTVSRILRRARLTAGLPLSGRQRHDLGNTTRIAIVGAYMIIYEPAPDGIVVIQIVHGKRNPKSWLR